MMLHQLHASHAFLAYMMPESAAEQQYHAVVCLQIRLQAALPGTYKMEHADKSHSWFMFHSMLYIYVDRQCSSQ